MSLSLFNFITLFLFTGPQLTFHSSFNNYGIERPILDWRKFELTNLIKFPWQNWCPKIQFVRIWQFKSYWNYKCLHIHIFRLLAYLTNFDFVIFFRICFYDIYKHFHGILLNSDVLFYHFFDPMNLFPAETAVIYL